MSLYHYVICFKNDVNKDNWKVISENNFYFYLIYVKIKLINDKYYIYYDNDRIQYILWLEHMIDSPILFESKEISKSLALLNIRTDNNLLKVICKEVLAYDNIAWIEKVEE
jgi:hypothetical protein